MTKEEEQKTQKELEEGASNLEKILKWHRLGILDYQSRLRNSSEKRLIPDPLKKDIHMAELWGVLSSKHFEPITEKTFHILEKLYVSDLGEASAGQEIESCDLRKLLEFFNSHVLQRASEACLGKTGAKATLQDNAFLHFAVSCKYYLPVLSGNSMIDDSFVQKFAQAWKDKMAAMVSGKPGQSELQSERKALLALLECSAQPVTSKSQDISAAIKALQRQVGEGSPERNELLEKLVHNMCREADSFAADFAITKIGEERQAQELFEHAQNIELKKNYLFKEIIKLERVQIAESIMRIETVPNQQNRFKITFDSTIMNQQIEMDFEELDSLNKLREYSLFGIHKTVPNSPFPHFSYCKELDVLCRDPDFKFEFSMPYNSDLGRFQRELASKKAGRNQQELAMCHHCKVLMPPSSFFVCSKKCKCLQSEPCSRASNLGDFLRKSIMGFKIRLPPTCDKTYCFNCITGWYNYGQEGRVSCPSCQKVCFCTRCNRFDNIEKFSQIYERLGGNIEELVRQSPASKLATRLLESKKDLKQNLERLYEARKLKESTPKSAIPSVVSTYNAQYKKLHLLKLISRQIIEREEFKRADLMLNKEIFELVLSNSHENRSVLLTQSPDKEKGRLLGKRIFEEQDHVMHLAVSRSKLDFDCNSTKSSSVTGDKEKFLKEEMNLIQRKHLLKKGSFKDLMKTERPLNKEKPAVGSNPIQKNSRDVQKKKVKG